MAPSTQIGRSDRAVLKRWQKLGLTVFLVVYFAYFYRDSLSVFFAPDDLMNIDQYWIKDPGWALLSQFQLWRGFYRPMAALFYLPLFNIFGLNPLPYHIAIAALLLANVYWVFRCAKVLGCEDLVAGLSAMIVCYHAGVSNVYYNIAFVYDVLCFFFYFAAFLCYVRIRSAAGHAPGWLRCARGALFFVLYLCALNSKEMAVTLPVVLLVYEWMYRDRPQLRVRELARWLWDPGRVALVAAALNVVYIYGKALGPDPMMLLAGYHPVFSFRRLRLFQNAQAADLLLGWNSSGWLAILVLWAVLIYLAWRRTDRPVLRFCCLFMALAPLPIEFLEARRGACLYIPLAGWAVFASVVFVDVARGASAFLAGEPLFRRLPRTALLALVVGAGVFLWARENKSRESHLAAGEMGQLGRSTADVIRQLRTMNPTVRPGSRVVFLNDPFQEWDMVFIADLYFRDRSVSVHLQRLAPIPPEDLARTPYVFDYKDGKLIQVR